MSDKRVTVLLDTNVFVAAYWARSSASARLIDACIRGDILAHYSADVKREVLYVLRTIKVRSAYIERIRCFWETGIEVQPVTVDVLIEDPDDRKFLEAALGGGTDFLVTNDEHLLSIGYIGRTEILTSGSAARLLGL